MTEATPLASEQITQEDRAEWLRGDWYEKWLDATENADASLMATLEALKGRVERTILAALSASPAPVGWKLVPVDLTYHPAMREAGWKHVDNRLFHGLETQMQAMWSAMLAASPAPSGQGSPGMARNGVYCNGCNNRMEIPVDGKGYRCPCGVGKIGWVVFSGRSTPSGQGVSGLPTNAVDDQGFSDAECNAILIDGYARDADRRGWRATGDALRRAAGFIRGYDELTAKAAPAPSCAPGEVERDAARWRALMNSDRIRMMGYAGFDFADDGTVTLREDVGHHMGVEVWDKHPAKGDDSDSRGRKVLMAYVDTLAALSPQGLDAKEGGE